MLSIVIRPVPESKCSLLTGIGSVLNNLQSSRFGRTLLKRHTISEVVVMEHTVTLLLLYTTNPLRPQETSFIQAQQQC